MMHVRTATARLLELLTVVASIRLIYLLFGYLTPAGGVGRPHVESASAILIGLGALLLLTAPPDTSDPPPFVPLPQKTWLATWPLWCVAAVAVYAPAMAVGLLSDDFVLVGNARQWNVGAFNADAFRPLPLFVWALVTNIGGSAVAIHVLNILLHGTNAWLLAKVAERYVATVPATMAGLLMLTLPLNVEAVTWNAAVFDVSATSCLLLAVLAGRAYALNPQLRVRAALIGLVVAGVLCKEAAVVIPVVVLVDAWVVRKAPRWLVRDCVALAAGGIAYGIVRLAASSLSTGPLFTKYGIQKYLFTSIGGLAFPWHDTDLGPYRSLVIAYSVILILSFVAFVIRRSGRGRPVIALGSWILLGTLPALSFLYVGPDLEGSRYLYASSAAWSILIAMLVDGAVRHSGPARVATPSIVIGCLVVAGVVAVRLHLAPWTRAAAVRDQVTAAAAAVVAQNRTCSNVAFLDLPDTYRGGFVFRNGFSEALDLAGVPLQNSSGNIECRYTWRGDHFQRVE